MKKISLKNLDGLGIERLSRENLKNITGGDSMHCLSDEDCPTGTPCIDGQCGGGGDGGCPNVVCSTSPGVGEGNYCANDNKSGTCGYRHGIWGCDAKTPC